MKPRSDALVSGPAFALASAFLFGASTPFAKLLLGSGLSPWLLAGVLYLGTGIGLSVWRVTRAHILAASPEAGLVRADVPWLALVVLTGGVAGPVLLMIGLSTTPASSASLLLNLEGLATMAIAWVVFRENVDSKLLVGAAAILGGAVFLSWTGSADKIGFGSLAIAGACLAWGIDNNLTRKLSASDPVQIALIKGLVAGCTNVALALAIGAHWPSMATVAGAAAIGFLGYGVSLVLFVLGLRHLGAARTGAYFSTAPFIGAALAFPLLGEHISTRFLIAGVLMGIGVYLHFTENHSHTHLHEEMDHAHRHVHDEHHQHEHTDSDPKGEPHTHRHHHGPLRHKHPHYPDLHHRHGHVEAH